MRRVRRLRALDELLELLVLDDLERRLADAVRAEQEHLPERRVHERDATARVQEEHALLHAREDAPDAIALGAELAHGDREAVGELIERAAELGELVGASEARARVEIALRHRVRDVREVADRARRELRREERHRDGEREREERAHEQRPPELRLGLLDLHERQRDAREPAVLHRLRDVEQALVDRVAQALRRAAARALGLHHLGSRGVVLDLRDAICAHLGVAEDAAVARDERDARVRVRAEIVGEGVPLADGRVHREVLGLTLDHLEAHEQVVSYALGEHAIEHVRQVRVRHDDGDRDDRHRREEELRAYAEAKRRARRGHAPGV